MTWTTQYARNPDGSFSVFVNTSQLASKMFWHNPHKGSKRGSWHEFSGPMTVDSALDVARIIMLAHSRILDVTVRDFSGHDFVLFRC